ncbi:MAG TPA: autotransporter outer membrane beta-barrel domain-containing protein [Gammaproteobacteria bacterium]|nr:autotransporter outer membrane beta-barrel domain-containing protein [Gammaproteobacteria bacterium]
MTFSLRNLLKLLSTLYLLQGIPAWAGLISIPEIPVDILPSDAPAIPGVDAEDFIAGTVVTDVDTVEAQVQPVSSAVSEHLHNIFRFQAAPVQGDGAGAGEPGQSFWLNYNSTDFENTFERTAFDGSSELALLGYDLALTENHLVGLAIGSESTEIDTAFNNGEMETEGLTVTPYYGWLISDNWSFDLSFGYSELDTDQFRVVPEGLGTLSGTTITSGTSSERSFATANLNGFWTLGDFSFSSRLGYLSMRNDQDAYIESDGTEVPSASLEFEQTYIGADVAWGRRSQPFLGVTMMKDSSSDKVVFASGEQPSDDADSLQLAAGWRYYGDSVSAMLEWSKRDGKEEYLEDGLWFILRFNSQ